MQRTSVWQFGDACCAWKENKSFLHCILFVTSVIYTYIAHNRLIRFVVSHRAIILPTILQICNINFFRLSMKHTHVKSELHIVNGCIIFFASQLPVAT